MMSQPVYNLRNVRKMLTTVFSDAELRQLCYDEPEFRPVYEQFAEGMSKDQMIQRLLEFCERKVLMPHLLEIVAVEAPEQYKQYMGAAPTKSVVTPQPVQPVISADEAHVQQLIQAKTRYLQELELQEAKMGLSTPPHIKVEIEDLKQELAELRQRLGR
jgi:hypothetical protein